MRRRIIFAVDSPLGYRVVLDRDRWRQIVRFKHPALQGKEQLLRHCVAAPDLIRESAKDEQVHLHYRRIDTAHLCVVVAPMKANEFFVVTAYFTKELKKGRTLWTK